MRTLRFWAGCALLATGSVYGQSATKSTVLEVQETRVIKAKTAENKRFAYDNSGVDVKLELTGPVIATAIKSGNTKITSATDDKGTDLTPKKLSRFNSRMKDINRKFMYFHEKEIPKDKIKIDLKIGLPVRNATMIKEITGSIDLMSGTKVGIKTAWPKLAKGAKITSPDIAKAELTFEITSLSAKAVNVKAVGKMDAIAEVDVVDAAGKSIKSGGGWGGWNNQRTYNISTKSAPGADASLLIYIYKDKKTVTVPIKLKDIKLR